MTFKKSEMDKTLLSVKQILSTTNGWTSGLALHQCQKKLLLMQFHKEFPKTEAISCRNHLKPLAKGVGF